MFEKIIFFYKKIGDFYGCSKKKRLSKFLSLVLRHKPQKIDLTLDERGFCNIEELLEKVSKALKWEVTKEDLLILTQISDDPKEKVRFQIEGDYIRAGHGHSIKISGYKEIIPKENLYHATNEKAYEIIKDKGLNTMNRQKVHLSYDKDITEEAAKRRSRKLVLLEVDIKKAIENGVKFYESADKRIVLSDNIPAEYLRVKDN